MRRTIDCSNPSVVLTAGLAVASHPHAPGKGYTRPYMDFNLDEIQKEKDKINKEQINQLLGENLELKEKSDSLEVYEKTWRRIASKFKGALESTFEKSADAFIKEIELKHAAKKKEHPSPAKKLSKKGKHAILLLSVIGSLIFAIVILVLIFSPAPVEPSLFSRLFS